MSRSATRKTLPLATRNDARLVYRRLQQGAATIHDLAAAVAADASEGEVIVVEDGSAPRTFYSLGLAYSAIDFLRDHGVPVLCLVGQGGLTEFSLGVTRSG